MQNINMQLQYKNVVENMVVLSQLQAGAFRLIQNSELFDKWPVQSPRPQDSKRCKHMIDIRQGQLTCLKLDVLKCFAVLVQTESFIEIPDPQPRFILQLCWIRSPECCNLSYDLQRHSRSAQSPFLKLTRKEKKNRQTISVRALEHSFECTQAWIF